MRRHLTVVLLTLASMFLSSIVVTGCAYRRADRSLVQPLALSKKQFKGEWYYMKTVYEAPFESGFFNGQGGWPLGAKIRWEITERYLYAFNASPNVRNTDSELTPLAAWPITSHFDIKPAINYMTGEPSNVIIEERRDGLPWYQRKYMRVMWERQSLSDWTDIFQTYYKWMGVVRVEPANYVAPQKVEMSSDYMTFVSDDLITKIYDSYYNMVIKEIPMSSYRVRTRHAFRKVKTSTYSPKEYNDAMFAKFGNFRTTVVRYNQQRGIVDWSYKFYASRHNVATQEELDKYAADNTPEDQQKPKQVVYYLSPDFPEELMEGVRKVEKGWNEAFQHALQRKDQVFEIRCNGYKMMDGKAECDAAKTGIRRDLGDLRYNFIWWVNPPQAGGLLGYGPSLADPDTGEIVHGSAYIYGAPLRQIVDSYMVLYDMTTGRYKSEDIQNGVEYLNAAFNLNNNLPLALPNGSTQKAINPTVTGPKVRTLNTPAKILTRIKSPGYLQRMLQVKKIDQASITASLSMIDNHPLAKQTLMHDEMVQLAFPGLDPSAVLTNSDAKVQEILNRYHPVEMLKPHRLRDMLNTFLAPSKMNMYMADYYDDVALQSFFKYHIQKKTPRNELRKRIMEFLFVSVTAHECGHTLSLTHNFKGSTDEYNYHDSYHDLAKDGKVKCQDDDKCPPDMKVPASTSKEDITAVQRFYRNASIMDYAGEYYDDTLGVGKTDKAAIAFIYGGLVEKAVSDPREQGELIKWSVEVERKNQNPNDPLKLRPFRFCSDYRVGQDPLCQRWDSGPGAVDIVQRIIKSYDRTYPLRYFRRGRRSYSMNAAFYRNFFGFQHIASIYQDWTYRVITQPGYKKTKDFEDKLQAIQTGFQFFTRILTTPRVGQHEFDKISQTWQLSATSEDIHRVKVDIPVGVARYMFSTVQDGYYGIFRLRRSGSLYDKLLSLMSMSIRSWGYYNNDVNWIYTNFYDLFTEDTTELFQQGISSVWKPDSPLLFKMEVEENGKKIQAPIEPGWHPFLQYNSMIYGLALLNNQLSDRTFQNFMRVGIEGSGKSWTPPGSKTVTCPDINSVTKHYSCKSAPVLCFMNAQKTRTYFGVQTEANNSVSWQLVKRGCELAEEVELLRNNTANVERSDIERKENELRLLETVLTYMQYYVSIYGG
ncbi:MAG TPA: hypothetical protein DCE42_23910 [Myxococcales bacterium]|nr:hypothetical protein [Deltaproteobacteria bacterium]HAA57833.1 hypothetical protein [Myxococcales bacterium]